MKARAISVIALKTAALAMFTRGAVGFGIGASGPGVVVGPILWFAAPRLGTWLTGPFGPGSDEGEAAERTTVGALLPTAVFLAAFLQLPGICQRLVSLAWTWHVLLSGPFASSGSMQTRTPPLATTAVTLALNIVLVAVLLVAARRVAGKMTWLQTKSSCSGEGS
ncbi:MAG: hypothetical protein ACOC8E_04660 [Planctomycetota bacterium]